ncbi:hypothetical protein BV22DRAFT_1135052 [Leucogyrophana mollusca]|uniref:Uncharacterized protein n=1 Tax=Leucogyrophana mollusca TaxID=85980 RepID=A0ACB8AX98_9AGAM|nr:hypothetical protein BV22DRAFT_1135052 [Leucogyrophana mollusca]
MGTRLTGLATEIKATGIPEASVFSNTQFYIQVKVGSVNKKTAVAKSASREVQWDSPFYFDVNGPASFKAEIYSHSLLGDTCFRKTSEVTIENLVISGAAQPVRMNVYDPQSDPRTAVGILEFSIVSYIVNPRLKGRQEDLSQKKSARFSGFRQFFKKQAPMPIKDIERSRSPPPSPMLNVERPAHSRAGSVRSRAESHLKVAMQEATPGLDDTRRSVTPVPTLKVEGEIIDDAQTVDWNEQAPPTPSRRQKLLDGQMGVLLRGLA